MARKARRRVGEKRLQIVINKIACARRCSLTSLVRSASPNGTWRVLWVRSASCLSSQSSLSVWWVHSFSSHRCKFLWSPTDFGTRHDINQEPLTPQQKKNRHERGTRLTLWLQACWFDLYRESSTMANASDEFHVPHSFYAFILCILTVYIYINYLSWYI